MREYANRGFQVAFLKIHTMQHSKLLTDKIEKCIHLIRLFYIIKSHQP